MRAHAESINLEFEDDITEAEAEALHCVPCSTCPVPVSPSPLLVRADGGAIEFEWCLMIPLLILCLSGVRLRSRL